MHANAVTVLREACRIAADGGATLLLEPVHMVIHGNLMAVRNIRQGLDLVEAVGSPALQLLADVFHNAVDGQTFEQAFADRMANWSAMCRWPTSKAATSPAPAACPGPRLVPLLQQRGYTGPIGLEYLPTLPHAESPGAEPPHPGPVRPNRIPPP